MTVRPYRDTLLALVTAYADSGDGQMMLDRLGPDTYPDPAKTSYNDLVSWRVRLIFGTGYFSGARVHYVGRWAEPHNDAPPGTDAAYRYADDGRDFPIEEAVDLFLSPEIPDWVRPSA